MKDESCFSIWLRSVLILDTFFQREGFYLSTKMILKMTIVHSPYLRSLQSLGLYLDSYNVNQCPPEGTNWVMCESTYTRT